MDGLKHPVGEQPPNVYWRRRVAVVAGIIVLGLLVWWILGALTSGTQEPGGGTTPDPTVSATTSPAAAADPGRDCAAEDFSVVTGPRDAEFTGDDLPTFTVTVISTAETPCVVDPATAAKIVVTSGDNTWFDSSTCTDYAAFDAEKFVLEAEATYDLTTTWNRGRDDAGCSSEPAEKQEGYYWIVATVQGVSADKIQFRLV
jgi:hypothetical protein